MTLRTQRKIQMNPIMRMIMTREQNPRHYKWYRGGSDGSTLSLDFTTMSSLDPLFTFSRSSTATFINSSGQVRCADHNLVQNSAFVGPNSGTGWVQNGGGTFTNSGTGSITTAVTASNQAYVSRTFVTKQGLRYSASVNVTSISGTINYNQVLAVAGSISADTFYRNGSVVNASTTAQTGLLTIIFTAGAGGTNTFRSGVGASGANQTNVTVVFDSVRAVEGENTQPTYFVSPSGSEYQAPRFDYDPSTLAPRGLLIEGSVTNLATRSEEIMNGVGNWIVGQNTTNTQNTTDLLDPAGTNKATKVVCNANAYCSLAQAISVSGNTQYTFSYWIRGTAGNDNRIYSYAGFTGELTARSAYSYSTTGWTRVQVTFTTNAATTAIYVYAISKQTAPATSDTLYVWGAQLEASSAASSYIPTGASTVQRTGEICYITPNTSWFNLSEGTIFQETAISFAASGFSRMFGFLSQTAPSFSTAPQSITIGLSGSDARPFLNLTQASTNRGDAFIPAGGAISQNTFFKMSSCYKQGDYRISRAGTSGTLTYSATYPTSLPTLHFNGIDGAYLRSVWYRSFKYFPTRLPNEQMDAWSA